MSPARSAFRPALYRESANSDPTHRAIETRQSATARRDFTSTYDDPGVRSVEGGFRSAWSFCPWVGFVKPPCRSLTETRVGPPVLAARRAPERVLFFVSIMSRSATYTRRR